MTSQAFREISDVDSSGVTDSERKEAAVANRGSLEEIRGGAVPVAALLLVTGAFTLFNDNACVTPQAGSQIERACQAKEEYERTGVKPLTPVEEYSRDLRRFAESSLGVAPTP